MLARPVEQLNNFKKTHIVDNNSLIQHGHRLCWIKPLSNPVT